MNKDIKTGVKGVGLLVCYILCWAVITINVNSIQLPDWHKSFEWMEHIYVVRESVIEQDEVKTTEQVLEEVTEQMKALEEGIKEVKVVSERLLESSLILEQEALECREEVREVLMEVREL